MATPAFALDSATPEQHRARYLRLRAAARARAEAPRRPADAVPVAVISEADIVHRETIPAGWYWSARVRRGHALRIVNPSGEA